MTTTTLKTADLKAVESLLLAYQNFLRTTDASERVRKEAIAVCRVMIQATSPTALATIELTDEQADAVYAHLRQVTLAAFPEASDIPDNLVPAFESLLADFTVGSRAAAIDTLSATIKADIERHLDAVKAQLDKQRAPADIKADTLTSIRTLLEDIAITGDVDLNSLPPITVVNGVELERILH